MGKIWAESKVIAQLIPKTGSFFSAVLLGDVYIYIYTYIKRCDCKCECWKQVAV